LDVLIVKHSVSCEGLSITSILAVLVEGETKQLSFGELFLIVRGEMLAVVVK